jgi:hypothetical protein
MRERKTVVLLLLAALFGMNFRCEKDALDRPFDHTFEIGVDIYPLKKSYRTTDTIWLETDVSGKSLFDTESRSLVVADTGSVDFSVSYYGFNTGLSDPPGSFADVIAFNQANTHRTTSPWNTVGAILDYGCGQPGYKLRVGFKPNHKGTYTLILPTPSIMGSCSNKVIPYHATLSYKYKASDLNMDVLTAFSKAQNLRNDQEQYYKNLMNNGRCFVFTVE